MVDPPPDVYGIWSKKPVLPKEKEKVKQQFETYRRKRVKTSARRKELAKIPVKEPEPKKPTYAEIKASLARSQLGLMQQIVSPYVPPRESFVAGRSLIETTKQRKQIAKLKKEKYQIRRTEEGYEFFKTPKQIEQELIASKKEELRRFYTGKPEHRVVGLGHWVTTGMLSMEDPLGIVSTYHAVRGEPEKALEVKAKAAIDLDKALKEGLGSYILKVSTGPMATVGTAFTIGAGVGAGVGALKATLPRIGKITEIGMGVGFGAMAVKETAPVVQQVIKTSEYAPLVRHAGIMGIGIGAGVSGYRTGHAFGYGRASELLYLKHTFKPGSAKAIRFKQALKVSRKLEPVKSHKMESLDITKDIMRMDAKSAAKTIKFLEEYPKTTIGGSAASYTQIEKARMPRDIDLLLRGGKKEVALAKHFFGRKALKTFKGEHRIDIHGKEFGKAGKYREFGFMDKPHIKIDKYKFIQAGEQVSRKGIAGVKLETQYRWFKDVPDFVTHAKSLIKSARLKPFGKLRAASAEKELYYFLHPLKHPKYGKPETIFSKFIRGTTKKPVQLLRKIYLSDTGIGKAEYLYPKSIYPYYPTGIAIGGYYGIPRYKTKPYVAKPYAISKVPLKVPDIYKIPKTTKTKYPVAKPYTKLPSYKPSKAMPYKSLLKPPPYKPQKQPLYKPTVYKKGKYPKGFPPGIPPNIKTFFDDGSAKKKKLFDWDKLFQKRYRYREFKIPKLSKLLKGVF